MKKLLVMVGSTATGKTDLAIKIAKKINGEIISADSRQVYKFMNIGTGKDLPKGAKLVKPVLPGLGGYYLVSGVRIWGYDLVHPKKAFSVFKYQKIAKKVIQNIWRRKKTPILVGGTGLYVKSVTEGIATVGIPRNESLRKNIEEKSKDDLYERLANLDPMKAAEMNFSDKNNPRRLVRAIEVAMWNINHGGRKNLKKPDLLKDADILKIGLDISPSKLLERIKKRVEARLKSGFDTEVRELLTKKIPEGSQVFDSIGYKQWKKYLRGRLSKKDAISLWEKEEEKYSKRQKTWFKKEKDINWYKPTSKEYPKNVEKNILSWYKSDNV